MEQKNDEIIVLSHTQVCATPISYARHGAKIKWVDIDPNTFVASLDTIKKQITKKTKAIIIVHLYGTVNIKKRDCIH